MLGKLSDGSLTELINLSYEVHVPEGERIKSVVATSDCLYVVLDGQIISTMASGFEGGRTQSTFAVGETLDEIEQQGEVNDCCEFLAVVYSAFHANIMFV